MFSETMQSHCTLLSHTVALIFNSELIHTEMKLFCNAPAFDE